MNKYSQKDKYLWIQFVFLTTTKKNVKIIICFFKKLIINPTDKQSVSFNVTKEK